MVTDIMAIWKISMYVTVKWVLNHRVYSLTLLSLSLSLYPPPHPLAPFSLLLWDWVSHSFPSCIVQFYSQATYNKYTLAHGKPGPNEISSSPALESWKLDFTLSFFLFFFFLAFLSSIILCCYCPCLISTFTCMFSITLLNQYHYSQSVCGYLYGS